mmetsp:Transcript_16348/g.46530  ORF Transcript_16348/g.46530 Transcript_16348/m.46530 type:complete len:316 (+) Transcript_16348:149-1096(+)
MDGWMDDEPRDRSDFFLHCWPGWLACVLCAVLCGGEPASGSMTWMNGCKMAVFCCRVWPIGRLVRRGLIVEPPPLRLLNCWLFVHVGLGCNCFLGSPAHERALVSCKSDLCAPAGDKEVTFILTSLQCVASGRTLIPWHARGPTHGTIVYNNNMVAVCTALSKKANCTPEPSAQPAQSAVHRHYPVVDGTEIPEERFEEVEVVCDVVGAARLATRMHRPLRDTHVDRTDAQFGREHGPDSAAAGRVVLDHKVLHGDVAASADFSEYGRGECVGGVALVDVLLQHNTLLQQWFVLRLVFVGVVGMHTMSHVGAHEE